MARVILVGLGSSGDVHALLGIVRALRPRWCAHVRDHLAALDPVQETCSAIEDLLAA